MTTKVEAPLNLRMAAANARPFYTRVAALGFGLIALTGLVAIGIGLATGTAGSSAGFALVVIVVGLLVGGLVWRFGRWALILAAVLSLALVGLLGPFSLFSLSHPESATDFVPIVLLLTGALLGLVGSVGAIVQWRRNTARAHATSTERLALSGLLGLVGLAVLLSIILTLASQTTVSAQVRAGATGVQIKNFAFAPNTVQVKAGDTVRLVVKNDDQTLHTFTLPQAGVNVSVPPGSEKVIEFKAPAAGTYQWYCIPHSGVDGGTRQGMVGTLQSQ
jgi:plastocyanin